MIPLERLCRLGNMCAHCQEPGERGDRFRASLATAYRLPAGFPACPYDMGRDVPPDDAELPPGYVAYPRSVMLTVGRTRGGIVLGEPPAPTAEQVASFLQAQVTGTRVPDDVRAEREATCRACPHARYSLDNDAPWCSICGCSVGGVGRWFLRKLTELAENLPKWGCHHPRRGEGEGWRR